jgi:hypothetical protein
LEPSRKMTSLRMISQRNQKMRLHEDRVLVNEKYNLNKKQI